MKQNKAIKVASNFQAPNLHTPTKTKIKELNVFAHEAHERHFKKVEDSI